MIAANAGIQTIKLYLIKYIKKGLKMELSIKQKESIIKKHPNITNIILFEMIDNKSTTDIIEKILKNNI